MASAAQARQFIENIGYLIQEEAKARGYKVSSPIIAQACVESAYGTSLLSARWFNFFWNEMRFILERQKREALHQRRIHSRTAHDHKG